IETMRFSMMTARPMAIPGETPTPLYVRISLRCEAFGTRSVSTSHSTSSNLRSISSWIASIASFSSSPFARTVITEPRPAARRRMPRIDLPSTSSSPLRILMSDLKRAAVCTSFAAARAWSPSLFLISMSRWLTKRSRHWSAGVPPALGGRLGRRARRSTAAGEDARAPSSRPRSGRSQEIRCDADRFRAFFADHVRQRGDVFRVALHRGELHDHRQIHAGDDLHPSLFEEGKADVARRAAEHVGEDDDAALRTAGAFEGETDLCAGFVDCVVPLQRNGFDAGYVCFDSFRRAQELVGELPVRDDQCADQIGPPELRCE